MELATVVGAKGRFGRGVLIHKRAMVSMGLSLHSKDTPRIWFDCVITHKIGFNDGS